MRRISHNTIHIVLVGILAMFVFFPFPVSATTAVIEVDTGSEEINALEGTLVVPTNVRVRETQTGNSVILIWITPPEQVGSAITFAGITPGGFMGTYPIFAVSGDLNAEDLEQMRFESVNALKNDGSGTSVPVEFTLSLVEPKDDAEPPEDFAPIISSDPNLFDGKYFLVFATQDKVSGIAEYKVREGVWGWFRVAESPYLLRHQSLDRKIFVKAIDKAGNERVVVLDVQRQAPWYRQYAVFGILLVMVATYFLLKKIVWPRLSH